MIIRPQDMKVEEILHLRDGEGTVTKRTLVPAHPDVHQRLLGRFTIKKGCSIGNHSHTGEVEYYYILSGEGVVTEDSGETKVYPGDVVVTGWGQSHSIRNEGDKDLDFVAVITTEK
ncbi:MAG: cupin domain-containing protein [Spirochaetales bacterium]|nr:cupin domain-containing protein [Spirochaetales bacterium]